MPRTYNYSSPDNIRKLKLFLRQPKTLKQIMKKFNIHLPAQGKQFITAATYQIQIYEFTENNKLLYGITQ